MANIFKIDRTANSITLGTTNTTINIASHTASKILALDASKNLEVVTIGSSLNYTRPTLDTIQDIRTSASPTFAGLHINSAEVVNTTLLTLESDIDNDTEYNEILFKVVGGANYGAIRSHVGASQGDSYMSLLTTTDGGTLVQQVIIQHDGKVGLGKFPSQKLDIVAGNSGVLISDTGEGRGVAKSLFFGDGGGTWTPIMWGIAGAFDDAGLHLLAETEIADDSGTEPLIRLNARQIDSTPITTRPILAIENDRNRLVTVDKDGNVGIGETTPETLTEWTGTAPYLTLHNSTPEDTDGGRESRLNFKGEQSGAEETTLARIEVGHDGSADDEKGYFDIFINDGDDGDSPTKILRIDSTGLFTDRWLISSTNTFLGINVCGSGNLTTNGLWNTAIGSLALQDITTGAGNTLIGYGAGRNITDQNYNTGIGFNALFANTTGQRNTAVGLLAGYEGNGSDCIFLGREAGYYETGSDKLFIDNDKRTNEATARVEALIYGVFAAATADQDVIFNADVGINTDPTLPLDVKAKAGITAIGGYAIKLTNKTGGNTVAGQIVKASTGTDDAFALVGVNNTHPIGIILETGVSDGSEAWIVVSGIVEVLVDAGGCVRGDRLITGAVGGFATVNNAPAVAVHFQEIGHCIETRAGAGLARCVLHFN